MFPTSAVGVVAAALAGAIICEGIAWRLVYSTAEYVRLRQRIDGTKKRMERERGKHTEKDGAKKDEGKKDEGKKEEGKKDDGRKIKRVIGRVEADLRILDSDMRQLYNRSALHTLALMVAVYWAVSSHYAGAAVATLPFTPYVAFDFAERPKPTDCSVFFLFVLCSMTFRPNLQKMLGFAPPKSLAQLQMAHEQANYAASHLTRR